MCSCRDNDGGVGEVERERGGGTVKVEREEEKGGSVRA